MSEEGESFEEWDPDFLDQLIQVEELALSAKPLPSQPPATASFLPPPPPLISQSQSQSHQLPHSTNFISYSPPRELSQRPSAASDTKDLEIDRLKSELGRVSKQLTDLERECFELRKEKSAKAGQIKGYVYSRAEQNDRGVPNLKTSENGVHAIDTQVFPPQSKKEKSLQDYISYRDGRASSSKTIGVQTENGDGSAKLNLNDDMVADFYVSEKLLGIWGCTSDQKLGRSLIVTLFMACPSDFNVLFGCESMNMAMESVATDRSSHVALLHQMNSFHTLKTTKVFELHSLLTKIGNGQLPLQALIGPLLNLCDLENVAIGRSSLRILHVALKHLFSRKRELEQRDNVKVEGLPHGKNKIGGLFSALKNEVASVGCDPFWSTSFDPHSLWKPEFGNMDVSASFSCVDWVSVFKLLHQIAVSNTDKILRLEAISIMNLILMRSNAYTEREKFSDMAIFESIGQWLQKDADSHVQKQALHLLHLLLNCPKILSIFCLSCKDEGSANAANDDINAPRVDGISFIFEGLADCISCCGNNILDIQLRKRAVTFLAFLASCGKSGFEILVGYKLKGEANLVMLILHVLVSETDMEASVPLEPAETVKARTLLIREVLILLNRLVSNPAYSATVMRVMTATRDVASLTIDVACRLSRNGQRPGKFDSGTWQIREAEIVDLALVFKKRVWSYLGDRI
ncbi:hypothetical protein K2173_002827 [Erythroxylum novogranatense]|uniref:Uncharacterized protein n=1 Tax=Erythroxylum novogranatense TaxID=1862640 RepID=A0AAV8SQ27_9ROSI|nr:hypothetical protein K2173_002827 [Erythroxylum novogranatense]